jgi:hypothetical protein
VRIVLHLVRDGAAPALVAEPDWVVYFHLGPAERSESAPVHLGPARLAHGGSPHTAPLPLGPLDHDQVVALAFAADLVVTW